MFDTLFWHSNVKLHHRRGFVIRTPSRLPCKPSRCAACTTTMRRSSNLTHATRACDRLSSRQCVKTTAAHHKPANVSSVNNNARHLSRCGLQRARVQSSALLPVVSFTLETWREIRCHRSQRLHAPNAWRLRRKRQHANGGRVRTRYLLQALYRNTGRSAKSPQTTMRGPAFEF